MGRPDLDSFEPGAVYRHLDSGEILEFLGVASMPELNGEDVGVFRFVQGGRYLIATKRGHAGASGLHHSPKTRTWTKRRLPSGAPSSRATTRDRFKAADPLRADQVRRPQKRIRLNV